MATFVLPSASSNDKTAIVASFSKPVVRPVEPVGQYFLAHAARSIKGHSWSDYEQIQSVKNSKVVDESDSHGLELDGEQSEELLTHDPREWKTADLYAALGLSKYRWRATTEDIKVGYRDAVLRHHPDKMAEKGGSLDKDGFFKIVQKAYETLLDPVQRKRFDSVDKNADVAPPPLKGDYDFFEAWTPIFESECRFSKKQPLPKLGDMNSTKAEVENFYSVWYKFDSWRTFEFLDEEAPDDSSNRDHKRYIEKKNKAARDKKKTEDNKRLLSLIDRAISEDPRIKLFKKLEKEEKARKKWEKEAGSRKAAEEAANKKKEEEEKKAKEEAEKKSAQENKKKSKEALKSAKKKNKRTIRNSFKDNEYFGDAGNSATIDSELDLLINSFNDVQLSDVAGKITENVKDSKDIITTVAKDLVAEKKIPEVAIKYFK